VQPAQHAVCHGSGSATALHAAALLVEVYEDAEACTSWHGVLQVDNVAEKLMPPGVRSLRNMLHATAVEVLLYLTPVHCHDMLSSLVEAMNAQFSRFMLRHPDFCVSPDLPA